MLGADGRKRRHTFHRVHDALGREALYAQAQAAIDGRAGRRPPRRSRAVLRAALGRLRRRSSAARDERAPLDLDLPERKILLKPDGTVDRSSRRSGSMRIG